MKNSVRKILALCAAAAISTVCLCTAVSAEENNAPVSYTYTGEEAVDEVEERAITAQGTYSNGSSYITLGNGGICYLHIVLTNSKLVRANGTYKAQGTNFRAYLNGYMVVDSNGNMLYSVDETLGVDGTFNSNGSTLTIEGITYRKD